MKMNISEEQLRSIVTDILLSLEKAGYLKTNESEQQIDNNISKKQAYVLCEADKEQEFLEFLRDNKNLGEIEVTAIMEKQDEAIIDTLVKEQLCQVISTKEAEQNEAIKISIYPSLKRSALCEAGLGMDYAFSSMWLRKDFESGRKSVILIGGIESFTGFEPIYYQEMILAYIKQLIRMDVRFEKNTEDILTVFEEINKRNVN